MDELLELYQQSKHLPSCNMTNNQRNLFFRLVAVYNRETGNTVGNQICKSKAVILMVEKYLKGHGRL